MDIVIREFTFSGSIENIFTTLYKDQPFAFWLDGNRVMEGLSRYSFMGTNPLFQVTFHQGKMNIKYPHDIETKKGDPFVLLQQLLHTYSLPKDKCPHLPFVGGFVGFFGYEMLQYVEKVPVYSKNALQVLEGNWGFYDQILIIDHVEHKGYVTRLMLDGRKKEEIERELIEQITIIKEAAEQKEVGDIVIGANQDLEISFYQTETISSYIKKILEIKKYITCGDIYQACFTYQLSAKIQSDPYRLYQVLRRINPAPFSCYMKLNELSILSSSPERFLKLDLEGILESRPIKGTRPRGKNERLDKHFIRELATSQKDRAENVMIVDLVRNDFARVCSKVHVPHLLRIESYATVHQLVSVVQGTLEKKVEPMHAIKAVFPGGSMTGAPKIRALKILHQLESGPRGIYSGGLGYLDVRGSFDLSMVIRTLIYTKKEAFFHVGGGIVADSDPEEEYQESLAKSYALKKAIIIAENQ